MDDCGKREPFSPLQREFGAAAFPARSPRGTVRGTRRLPRAVRRGGGGLSERKTPKEERRARRELRSTAREIAALRYRLLGILASLPPRQDEVVAEVDMGSACDASTEMRLAVQCVLRDHLEPAIASLRTAVRFRTGSPEEE